MTNLFDDLPWREHDELDELDDLEFGGPELSLSMEQQVALSAAVAEHLRSCDGTLRGAEQWARSAGVDWPPLRRELEENGGFCDCEAVFNVFGGDFDQVSGVGGLEPD